MLWDTAEIVYHILDTGGLASASKEKNAERDDEKNDLTAERKKKSQFSTVD